MNDSCSQITAKPFDKDSIDKDSIDKDSISKIDKDSKTKIDKYSGYYGQGVVFQLSGWDSGGSYITYDKDTSCFVWNMESHDKTVMELARENPDVKNRERGRVYIGDAFYIRLGGEYAALSTEGSKLSLTFRRGDAAHFMLQHKYSGCPANGREYDASDINNRNKACRFPYTDCIGRCGKRKLLVRLQNGKWGTVGTTKKCGTYGSGQGCPVTWAGIGDWTTYEMNLW